MKPLWAPEIYSVPKLVITLLVGDAFLDPDAVLTDNVHRVQIMPLVLLKLKYDLMVFSGKSSKVKKNKKSEMPPLSIDFEASQYGMPFFNYAMPHSQACVILLLCQKFLECFVGYW